VIFTFLGKNCGQLKEKLRISVLFGEKLRIFVRKWGKVADI
jgi:hypothetical protein